MSHKHIILTLLGAVFLAISITFALGQMATQSAPLHQNAFPAFTMVYTQGKYGLGENGKFGTARYEVNYTDRYHWKVTLLESDTMPEANGSWGSYDGVELKGYYAQMGMETANNVLDGEDPPQEEEIAESSTKDKNSPSDDQSLGGVLQNTNSPDYAPEQWLHPSYIPKLLTGPNTTPKDSAIEGTKALIVTEPLPCRPLLDVEREAGLKECEKERVATREVIYRSDTLIPVQIIDSLDNVVFNTITVEKLEIK